MSTYPNNIRQSGNEPITYHSMPELQALLLVENDSNKKLCKNRSNRYNENALAAVVYGFWNHTQRIKWNSIPNS